ncbi:MAG: hypothetical protein ABWY93_06750 [Mycobacterium sp.]
MDGMIVSRTTQCSRAFEVETSMLQTGRTATAAMNGTGPDGKFVVAPLVEAVVAAHA